MRVLWSAPLAEQPAAISVSGALAAVAGTDGALRVLDSECGRLVAEVNPGLDMLTDVAVSPSGTAVALTGARGHGVWESSGILVKESGAWCTRAVWADNGRLAVAAGKSVVVYAADGSPAWRTEPGRHTLTDVAWDAKQRSVAASGYGGVRMFARHSPRPVHEYAHAGPNLCVAVSATGRWVCSGNQDAVVRVWKTNGGDLQMPGLHTKVTKVRFDPTGRWLANTGHSVLPVWDFGGASGPAGSRPRMLGGHGSVVDFAWRGCSLGVVASVGSEGEVRVWSVPDQQPGRPAVPLADLGYDDAVRVAWIDLDTLAVARPDGVDAVRLEP